MTTAVLPDDLTVLSPGPGLAAALGGVDPAGVPNDEMLGLVRAQYRQLCHEQARMAAVLAELGRCEGFPEPGVVARLEVPERYAAEEARAALRWTRRAAEREHELAETVVHAMPLLHAAWLAGQVDRPRVVVFDRFLVGLAPEQVGAILRVAVPRAAKLTTGQLAVLLARMVVAVDPQAAARWYRKAVRERNVVAHLGPDGTVTMSANGLPADQAEAACMRLQELAVAAKRAGHPGLIGQIRCDLFLGLLDGRFQHLTREQILAVLIADYRPDGPGAANVPADPADPADPAEAAAPAATPPPGEPHRAEPGRAEQDSAESEAARSENAESEDAEPGAAEPENAESEAAEPGAAEPDRAGSGDARADSAGSHPAGSRPGGSGAAGSGAGGSDRRPPGRGPGCGVQAGIEVRVGLATLLGRDEHPGEIPGLGLLPAPDTRARVARQPRAQWRFAVTDAKGRLLSEGVTRRRPPAVGAFPVRGDGPPGGIVEIHIPVALLHELTGPAPPGSAAGGWYGVLADVAAQHAHRHHHWAALDARPHDRLPTAALRRHTQIRDRTCTFPGCRHRASAADLDHTRDHTAGGATVGANLGPVCDHDHDVKHRAGWTVTQPQPGSFLWRSPLGGQYPTRGEFLLADMPEPFPIDLGEHFDHPTAPLEGPILQPYRPVPRPPPPPTPARDLPDEPPF